MLNASHCHRGAGLGPLLVVQQRPRDEQEVLHLAGHAVRRQPLSGSGDRNCGQPLLGGPRGESVAPRVRRGAEDVMVLEHLADLEGICDAAHGAALGCLDRLDATAEGHRAHDVLGDDVEVGPLHLGVARVELRVCGELRRQHLVGKVRESVAQRRADGRLHRQRWLECREGRDRAVGRVDVARLNRGHAVRLLNDVVE